MKITLKTNWATKHPKEPFWSFEIDEKELAKQLREQNYDLWIPKPEEKFCECNIYHYGEYLKCGKCGKPLKPQFKAELPEEMNFVFGSSSNIGDKQLAEVFGVLQSKINQIIRYLQENRC